MLYDWAVQPHYTLVQDVLFGPYFANAVVQNSVCGSMIAEGSEKAACGQALWGYAAIGCRVAHRDFKSVARRRCGWARIAQAVDGCPIARVSREPFNTVARDTDANGTTILIVLAGFVGATLAAELMSVFSNAIMTGLEPREELGPPFRHGLGGRIFRRPRQLGRSSPDCWSPMPGEAKTLLGLEPLLTLDGATHQGDRITGPFAAIWFAVFIIPFFLFVPDRHRPATGHPGRSAIAELWDTIKSLPSMPSLMIFLLARMLYTDGLSAIFAFGGIYGASVFGWGPLELGIFESYSRSSVHSAHCSAAGSTTASGRRQ